MKIIIIGSSTGGPYILEQIFSQFPPLPVCIIIIQHLPANFIQPFRDHINELTVMETEVIKEGTKLTDNRIYIAPGGYHLLIRNNRDCLLDSGEKIHGVRPAIDRTMFSMVERIGDHMMGVILTGMGHDGAQGIAHMHLCGAVTIAQEPSTAPIKSMPQSAIETGMVDKIYTPGAIRDAIIQFADDPGKGAKRTVGNQKNFI